MKYQGRYSAFDASRIRTYPVSQRTNKVTLDDLVDPATLSGPTYDVGEAEADVIELARCTVEARNRGRAVIFLTGAHMIKNGLGLLLVDLVKRGIVSLAATNGAGVIHDFELALIGQTSEYVPNALPEGKFGMACEFGYINTALQEANERQIGYGEGVGAMICDDDFRVAVEKRLNLTEPIMFRHPDVSVIAACYTAGVPLTVHVGIGTDVTDQHANFDGQAKGGCSGRDFLIFTHEAQGLSDGGVFINNGCAVTGPEVLLKAVSMIGNVGRPPHGLITANFDLKPYLREVMTDEASTNYYYRDHKSVVTRVPDAFDGRGFYIQGDQRSTLPRFYQEVIKRM